MSIKLKSISPSRIKTFDLCKFKYWLTYHCPDVELKSNYGAANGSLLHDILENYSLGRNTDWASQLYDGFGGKFKTLGRSGDPTVMDSPLIWAKDKDFKNKKPFCDNCPYRGDGICDISLEPLDNLSGCPKELFEQSGSMLQQTIARYEEIWDKTLRDNDGNIIGTEYELNVKIPGTDVPLIGYMDLVIEEDPETIHIIDYKTGSWTQSYDECREDIQVRAYSWAGRKEFIEDVNNKGYGYKYVFLTFDYFVKSPVLIALSKEEDFKTERYLAEKVKEIQSTSWISRIVNDNSEFELKKNWKCRSLCDTKVCMEKWSGGFKIE